MCIGMCRGIWWYLANSEARMLTQLISGAKGCPLDLPRQSRWFVGGRGRKNICFGKLSPPHTGTMAPLRPFFVRVRPGRVQPFLCLFLCPSPEKKKTPWTTSSGKTMAGDPTTGQTTNEEKTPRGRLSGMLSLYPLWNCKLMLLSDPSWMRLMY